MQVFKSYFKILNKKKRLNADVYWDLCRHYIWIYIAKFR